MNRQFIEQKTQIALRCFLEKMVRLTNIERKQIKIVLFCTH